MSDDLRVLQELIRQDLSQPPVDVPVSEYCLLLRTVGDKKASGGSNWLVDKLQKGEHSLSDEPMKQSQAVIANLKMQIERLQAEADSGSRALLVQTKRAEKIQLERDQAEAAIVSMQAQLHAKVEEQSQIAKSQNRQLELLQELLCKERARADALSNAFRLRSFSEVVGFHVSEMRIVLRAGERLRDGGWQAADRFWRDEQGLLVAYATGGLLRVIFGREGWRELIYRPYRAGKLLDVQLLSEGNQLIAFFLKRSRLQIINLADGRSRNLPLGRQLEFLRVYGQEFAFGVQFENIYRIRLMDGGIDSVAALPPQEGIANMFALDSDRVLISSCSGRTVCVSFTCGKTLFNGFIGNRGNLSSLKMHHSHAVCFVPGEALITLNTSSWSAVLTPLGPEYTHIAFGEGKAFCLSSDRQLRCLDLSEQPPLEEARIALPQMPLFLNYCEESRRVTLFYSDGGAQTVHADLI